MLYVMFFSSSKTSSICSVMCKNIYLLRAMSHIMHRRRQRAWRYHDVQAALKKCRLKNSLDWTTILYCSYTLTCICMPAADHVITTNRIFGITPANLNGSGLNFTGICLIDWLIFNVARNKRTSDSGTRQWYRNSQCYLWSTTIKKNVGRTQIARVKIWAPWAKGAQNGGEKWVFCKKYNEVSFLCNGTDQHEIPTKTSIVVLCRTLIDEFRKFSLKGWFCPQTAIFASFWPVSVLHGYRWQVTFLDFARPSIC